VLIKRLVEETKANVSMFLLFLVTNLNVVENKTDHLSFLSPLNSQNTHQPPSILFQQQPQFPSNVSKIHRTLLLEKSLITPIFVPHDLITLSNPSLPASSKKNIGRTALPILKHSALIATKLKKP